MLPITKVKKKKKKIEKERSPEPAMWVGCHMKQLERLKTYGY